MFASGYDKPVLDGPESRDSLGHSSKRPSGLTIHGSPSCPGEFSGVQSNKMTVEVRYSMRALEIEMVDAVWAAVEPRGAGACG